MRFLVITDYLDFVGGGFEPLGVLYIISAVRSAGYEVRMIENDFQKASNAIREWHPDFVGYCLYTGYHKPLIELNRQLKQRYEFLSVFGGPHPTFFPEMINEEGVDIVCRGEGEEAVVELLERAQKGEDFNEVKSLWVKCSSNIYTNPMRPLQPQLEKFHFPARDLFYQFPRAFKNKVRVVVTARGCPYACTYWYNYRIKDLYEDCGINHLRHRPVDNVIEEILQIREHYPIEFIYFGTDCFTAKKDWVLEFAEKYRRQVNIPFLCSTRPETTNLEICRALKNANCIALYMGIESGNAQIRNELLNRKMSNQRIVKAAEDIHRAELKLATFNMMALPGETVKNALDTLKINQQCHTDFTWVSLFQPYPRTKLAEYAIEKGYFDGNFDALPMSWHRKSALKNPQKKKLERLQKLASIGVEFPWLTSIIKLAIFFPLAPLYLLIMKFHKAYCYRYRIMPVKLNIKEVFEKSYEYLFDSST